MSRIIYVTQFVFFITISMLVLNQSQDVKPIQPHHQSYLDFDLNKYIHQSKFKDWAISFNPGEQVESKNDSLIGQNMYEGALIFNHGKEEKHIPINYSMNDKQQVISIQIANKNQELDTNAINWLNDIGYSEKMVKTYVRNHLSQR